MRFRLSLVLSIITALPATALQEVEAEESGLTLSEEVRTFLWDVEHHTTILSTHGFPIFVDALESEDAEALRTVLSEDFRGSLPAETDDFAVDAGFARAESSVSSGHTAATAEEFTRWLLELRGKLKGNVRAKVAVIRMAPAEREQFDGLWRGSARIRMWGDDGAEGRGEVFFYVSLELEKPTEEAFAAGGWLRSCAIHKVRIAHASKLLMHEVSEEWGFETKSLHDNWDHGPDDTVLNPGGVYVFDYNRDGVMDVLVNDLLVPRLYGGQPDGGFVDVTEEVGLPAGGATLVAAADLDGDGWEDLILGPGTVFKNVAGRKFENVTAKSNLATTARLVRTHARSGIAFGDYDRDGFVDLYVYRTSTDPSQGSWTQTAAAEEGQARARGARNQLLRNLGGWLFEDVTEKSGTAAGTSSTFSSVWLDANDDAWPDLYVIHEFGNGTMLVNRRDGTFEQRDLVDEPADFGSMGLTCGDFDNDGGVDLYVASMYTKSGTRVVGNLPEDAYDELTMKELRRMVAGSQLYRNTGDVSFDRLGETYGVYDVGWAYGPAAVDFDGDGFLDIFATTGFVSRTREKPDG